MKINWEKLSRIVAIIGGGGIVGWILLLMTWFYKPSTEQGTEKVPEIVSEIVSEKVPETVPEPPKVKPVVPLNPCEQMQEEKPLLRAVGKGTHSNEQTAKNIAEMQARAQFTRAIASKILTATSIFSSGDDVTVSGATDQVAKQNDFAMSIAEGIVRNTIVIKTHKEQHHDNKFDVWLCLEYQGDVSKMASEIVENVQQRVSDEQRTKMNSEIEQFRNRVQTEFEL